MHLDEEQIQRLLHGELGPAATSVRDHLDSCAACRLRLDESEGEEAWIFDRLRVLDHAQPTLKAEAILVGPRPPRAFRWGRMAAGIFLTLAAAGVAYAAPGSPLPRVIAQIIGLMRGVPQGPVRTTPRPAQREAQAGIAVLPGDRLTIVFPGDRASDTAIVSLADSAEVMVRARGGSTTFTSDNDRLAIGHQGAPATFEILIPRAARWVEIRSGDRSLWRKEDARILTDSRQDSGGRYRIMP